MTENYVATEKKIVFLESDFWKKGTLTNEMELFYTIAEIVGAHHTAVKRHTDVTPDRFTPMGIQVLQNGCDLDNKLLISPFVFCETLPQGACLISLDNMLRGDVSFLKSESHMNLKTSVANNYNVDSVRVWYPGSDRELQLLLDILKNKLLG